MEIEFRKIPAAFTGNSWKLFLLELLDVVGIEEKAISYDIFSFFGEFMLSGNCFGGLLCGIFAFGGGKGVRFYRGCRMKMVF